MSTSVAGPILTTQGTDCGQLSMGSIFEVDVTDYFAALLHNPMSAMLSGLFIKALVMSHFQTSKRLPAGCATLG